MIQAGLIVKSSAGEHKGIADSRFSIGYIVRGHPDAITAGVGMHCALTENVILITFDNIATNIRKSDDRP